MTSYLKLYTLLFVLTLVALAVVFYLLERFLSIDPPGGAATAVPPLVSAMQVGGRFAQDMSRIPSKQEAWQGAWRMTAIATVVNVVLSGLLLLLPEFRAVFAGLPAIFLVAIVVILLGLVLLANRWGVMFGAKSALRALEKKAGK